MKLSSIMEVAKKVRERQELIDQLKTVKTVNLSDFTVSLTSHSTYQTLSVPRSAATVDALAKMIIDDLNSRIKTLTVELRDLGVAVDTDEPVLKQPIL